MRREDLKRSALLLAGLLSGCVLLTGYLTPPRCSDGVINGDRDEECDDGNLLNEDGCDSNCKPTSCGNGVVTTGEECDDGNLNNGDSCEANCTLPFCGNGIPDPLREEECDGEPFLGNACSPACVLEVCGDNAVNNNGTEECDDGNLTSGDGCDADCRLSCGNGVTDNNEGCDDGNRISGDGCTQDCVDEFCGDGVVNDSIEQCEDGNTTPGDGCENDCLRSPLIQVAVGGQHVCVLLNTGAVRCWGESDLGRLGYGLSPDIGDDETPASIGDVPLGGVATQLALGSDHSCALLETGNVRCWGNNAAGKLGYGTLFLNVNETPAQHGDISLGGTVTQIAAGQNHNCALLDNGNVRCWGANNLGQLGYGNLQNIGDNELPSAAGDVQIGGVATQITAGLGHTCALLDTGAIRCWGQGAGGRLGYGNINNIGDNELPSTAGDVQIGGAAVAVVASGNDHTCALLDTGAVRCWGASFQGKLGYPNVGGTIGAQQTPVALYDAIGFPGGGDIQLGGSAAQITTGAAYSCARLTNGDVYCWGDAAFGEIGYANNNDVGDNETPASVGPINLGAPATFIASGFNASCAILETNELRCWGDGSSGLLGLANTISIGDNEIPTNNLDLGGESATQISAGGNSTCVITSAGGLRCWGEGDFSQSGYSTTTWFGDEETPAELGDITLGGNPTAVSVGARHTCALLDTGNLRCWGRAFSGELGYGSSFFNGIIGDNETPASAGDVPMGGVVVQLSSGLDHSCVVLQGGGVRCWGLGAQGRLGYGNGNNIGDDEAVSSAVAGDVQIGGAATQIAAGGAHTCALLDTGRVRCWGFADLGQLGYDSVVEIGDVSTPNTVYAGLPNNGDVSLGNGAVVQLVAGNEHSCALLQTGAVHCWGRAAEGQLGYGNENNIGDDELPSEAYNILPNNGDINFGGAVITQISAGLNHTCALSAGEVYCWGRNVEGQLGYGSTQNIGDNETPGSLGSVPLGATVTQVTAGGAHTCVLLNTGDIRCWGLSSSGQLGLGLFSVIVGDDETPADVASITVF